MRVRNSQPRQVAGVSVPGDLDMKGFEAFIEKDRNDGFRLDRIAAARELIRQHLVKGKSITRLYNSLALKQTVEQMLGLDISNGELIVAMIGEGYIVERQGKNCCFNISSRELKKVRLELAFRKLS